MPLFPVALVETLLLVLALLLLRLRMRLDAIGVAPVSVALPDDVDAAPEAEFPLVPW